MEKNVGALATILVILCLIVGFTAGYVVKDEKIVYEDKIVEVPVDVEVEKLVEVEVISTDTQPLLDTAIADFLEEVEDVEDCGGVEYDEDQIAVKKIYDVYSVVVDDEDYSVDFKVKLKYLDGDVEEKCYNTYDVSVLYEEDKDPKVTIA